MTMHIEREQAKLRIAIPTISMSERGNRSASPDSLFSDTSFDSLFDQEDRSEAAPGEPLPVLVANVTPPIPGLYFNDSVRIPQDLATTVTNFCQEAYFRTPGANQVMLFGRAPVDKLEDTEGDGLPPVLMSLLDAVALLLRPILPEFTYTLLFPPTPTQARQAIINLYHPGEGITPHVDLIGRYADGIIGVSFGSGCAMRFDRVANASSGAERNGRWDMYLPERSVIVLSDEARYGWTHGIEKRTRDYVGCAGMDDVGGCCIDRSVRISVTFRWMLEGAEILR